MQSTGKFYEMYKKVKSIKKKLSAKRTLKMLGFLYQMLTLLMDWEVIRQPVSRCSQLPGDIPKPSRGEQSYKHLASGFHETGEGHKIDIEFIKVLLALHKHLTIPPGRPRLDPVPLPGTSIFPTLWFLQVTQAKNFEHTVPFSYKSLSSFVINEKSLKFSLTSNNSFV